jgi:hypothetical protein
MTDAFVLGVCVGSGQASRWSWRTHPPDILGR